MIPHSLKKYPLILILLLILIQTPFILFMPFHIDDDIFLRIVDNIHQHPLTPLMQPVIWEGQIWSDMMSYTHPPLVCYYIYLLKQISGPFFEQIVHLGFLPFFILLGLAFYYFFRFLKLPGILGALVALFSPLIFTASHTIMMDIPTLAFGLTGVVFSLYGLRDDHTRFIFLGGFFFGLAVLVSYSAILYLFPVAVYALASRKTLKKLVFLCIPPFILFCSWLALVYFTTGRFIPADVVTLLDVYQARPHTSFFPRLLYNLIMTGGAILFPLALFLWRFKTIRGKVYLLIMAPLGFFIRLYFPEESFYHHLFMSILAAAGIILLVEAIVTLFQLAKGKQTNDRAIWWALGSWIGLFYLVTLFAFPCGAARYQIWLLPPLTAVFLASLKGSEKGAIFRRKIMLGILIVGQVAMGSIIAVADMEMARAYRSTLDTILQCYQTDHNTIWIASEWELRHTVISRGGRTILRYDGRPRPADILIKPVLTATTYATGYEQDAYSFLLDKVDVRSTFPFRILNPIVRAGFYSDYWGFMPVWIAGRHTPIDVLHIYLIKRPLPASPDKEKENYAVILDRTQQLKPEEYPR